MQSTVHYRPFPQQVPQRSPAAAAQRRGIGPMVGGHPGQAMLTQAQNATRQETQKLEHERARRMSSKPTDKNIPEGVEDCIIGDGVQKYRELRELERRLDATMTRKRLDMQDAVNRNVKRYRTLRVWISNTVEDQPWQADTLDVDAFDFSTNIDSSYRVKIEGRLLDEEDDFDSESDDDDDQVNGGAMDEDGEDKQVQKKKKKLPTKQYKFSHFFKSMTVDYDRTKAKDVMDQSVEWKKPVVAPNATNLPNAADFDQLEFKRGGDENMNITINLVREENPERFKLSAPLADILDTDVATRADVMMGLWEYIKAMNLQDDDEKRAFDCDDRLKALLRQEKGYIPSLPEAIMLHLSSLPPIKLPYTIRVDKEFHENPQPTIYDIKVQIDDPLKAALTSYLTNPTYAHDLKKIAEYNAHLGLLIQKIVNSKSKHTFFDQLSKNPTDFIARWLSSQKRDLEIIAGERIRGGGEDVTADNWRKGGKDSIWATDHVRESVNLIVNPRSKLG